MSAHEAGSSLSRFARTIRLLIAGLFASALAIGGVGSVVAQTTTETDVTIVIVNDGTLDVHWGDSPIQFLADGASPTVTAVDSAHATATFSLVIHDTRADSSRAGYSVVLTSAGIGTEGSGAFFGPDHLLVSNLTGLPEGASTPKVIGSTLAEPLTVISVPANAPAVDTTVTTTISLTIPAGTMPGTYSGDFSLDVITGSATAAP